MSIRRPACAVLGLVSGLHWIMPKGTSAPGNSPTVPGLTGPVAVPSRGWTSAAGSVVAVGGGVAPAAGSGTPNGTAAASARTARRPPQRARARGSCGDGSGGSSRRP